MSTIFPFFVHLSNPSSLSIYSFPISPNAMSIIIVTTEDQHIFYPIFSTLQTFWSLSQGFLAISPCNPLSHEKIILEFNFYHYRGYQLWTWQTIAYSLSMKGGQSIVSLNHVAKYAKKKGREDILWGAQACFIDTYLSVKTPWMLSVEGVNPPRFVFISEFGLFVAVQLARKEYRLGFESPSRGIKVRPNKRKNYHLNNLTAAYLRQKSLHYLWNAFKLGQRYPNTS